jgi:hypothetical protein
MSKKINQFGKKSHRSRAEKNGTAPKAVEIVKKERIINTTKSKSDSKKPAASSKTSSAKKK